MAWPLIQIYQLLFCSVPHRGLTGLQSVNVAGAVIPLSDKVKILGATLDANLTMAPHIKALSSSCFYHICSFRQMCSSLDDTMALSVASALISSHLDQLNSILYGTSFKHIARFQRIQHAAARSWTSILAHLHCLQVNFLNNSIGFLLNGIYGLNLPPWPLKLCILVARDIFLTSCNTTNPRGLWAHLVLIIFQSPVIT